MSDITNVADELRNFSQRRKKPGTRGGGKTHAGLKHLQNADHDRIAERLLPDGTLNFNIAIRTVTQIGTDLTLGVGGGITIESENENEYMETLMKASSFQP